jgi:hypothetical protein
MNILNQHNGMDNIKKEYVYVEQVAVSCDLAAE